MSGVNHSSQFIMMTILVCILVSYCYNQPGLGICLFIGHTFLMLTSDISVSCSFNYLYNIVLDNGEYSLSN